MRSYPELNEELDRIARKLDSMAFAPNQGTTRHKKESLILEPNPRILREEFTHPWKVVFDFSKDDSYDANGQPKFFRVNRGALQLSYFSVTFDFSKVYNVQVGQLWIKLNLADGIEEAEKAKFVFGAKGEGIYERWIYLAEFTNEDGILRIEQGLKSDIVTITGIWEFGA